jgi:hypothetical protein
MDSQGDEMNPLNSREFDLFVRRRKRTVFVVGTIKFVIFAVMATCTLLVGVLAWGLTC